jgi:hypothetical protein
MIPRSTIDWHQSFVESLLCSTMETVLLAGFPAVVVPCVT